MKTLLAMDFDGTVTVEEVSVALLEAFAEGDWREPDRLLRTGQITLEECMRRQFAMIKRPREELVRFAQQTAQVRPGFEAFLRFCYRRDIAVTICSAGMDVYVEAVLALLDVPSVSLLAGKATFRPGGIRVAFPPRTERLDFKATFVQLKGKEGHFVIYVGDGISDEGAAQYAHFVFARDRLLAFCQRSGLPHLPFEDFWEVRRGLEQLLGKPP